MKSYKIIIFVVLAAVITACQAEKRILSPTETLKAFKEASTTKDIETTKKLISKNTLALVEKSAKDQNITVDELLKKDDGVPFQELPETRNEKINGDAATVEIKDTAVNDWATLPFVKEDGIWKIALDKFVEDEQRKATEDKNNAPVIAPPSNVANSNTGGAVNKPKSNSAVNK